MTSARPLTRLAAAPAAAVLVLLAACAGAFDPTPAHAAPGAWPPTWQDSPGSAQTSAQTDFTVPRFEPPSASHCHRAPTTREVPGSVAGQSGASSWRGRMSPTGRPKGEYRSAQHEGTPASLADAARREAEPTGAAAESLAERRTDRTDASRSEAPAKSADAAGRNGIAAPAAPRSTVPGDHERAMPSWPQPQPLPQSVPPLPRQRPAHEGVKAGMVDDNADFGEYLSYRGRNPGLPVRDRDIAERYLLEVTDAAGRPVHDAEVAVQRAGRAEPLMWARTDTAGRVWLHPRAFLSPGDAHERALGVAVRKGSWQGRAALLRGEKSAVQVRLGQAPATQRPRLDLVFMIDATGSMGDEIAKLKASMRAVSQQIAQLPGQPDLCYGLVAYRDRGDAYITRTHDFTDDLGAFQQMLARVQAGGGGDTPEALNEALHEVVHGLSWRADAARMVVLVADAPPHLDYGGCMEPPEADGFGPHGAAGASSWPLGQRPGLGRPGACPQYDVDMQAALAKGIKLFAVGASGLDPVGEYIYRQMAQYTAGRFVFLTYKDAANPASGPGAQTGHDVKNYSVQTLDRLIVRLVSEEMARLVRA